MKISFIFHLSQKNLSQTIVAAAGVAAPVFGIPIDKHVKYG
ncbi:hypothetical protein PCIT_b0495 [Pseudoalteromonas citrea]|uniref:Uncharacterized protein n=1 Tax=Pseudoalteromonas citrea TaxID=43655 RepID=A0AAD4AEI4_9GAMM|nr:hypothetical protein PCIT_b0495 [Pseudoalteromonas citrea]